MTMPMRAGRWLLALLLAGMAAPVALDAQAPSGQEPVPADPAARGGRRAAAALANPESLTVQQVEQLFDRYMAGRARVALQLDPEQMLAFGPKLARLQMVRRRFERQRQVLLGELNALSRAEGQTTDDSVSEKLRALDDLARARQTELDGAYKDIDALLTSRQRARFRVFELRMEQEKLDLISRARQRARGAAR